MDCDPGGGNTQGATRSVHQDGVFIAMCDGSVRFISDFVELGIDPPDDVLYADILAVWDRLIAANDGLVIDGRSY